MRDRNVQDMVAGAARSGWEWFEGADEKIRERLDVRQALEGEDGMAVARAWADFAATPGGQKALLAMAKATLDRTVFFVNLGLDPMSMAVFGAFREGQNALAHEIFRQIAKGQGETLLPRDVT